MAVFVMVSWKMLAMARAGQGRDGLRSSRCLPGEGERTDKQGMNVRCKEIDLRGCCTVHTWIWEIQYISLI